VFLIAVAVVAGGPRESVAGPIRDRLAQRRGAAPLPATPGTSRRTVAVDGQDRTFLVHPPPGDPAAPLPVVLSFHGLGSDPEQEERISRFSELADREGFLAVYPQGLGKKWRVFDRSDTDLRFFDALLATLAEEFQLDSRRVYATGISNGAQMAWRLACDRPAQLAGVGLVSGGYSNVCGDQRPSAVLFHGTADHLLPYSGRFGQMNVRSFAIGWSGARQCASEGAAQAEVVYEHGDARGERWTCGSREAVLYTLTGKGHSWPGSSMPSAVTSADVDASEVMWRFFRQHTR